MHQYSYDIKSHDQLIGREAEMGLVENNLNLMLRGVRPDNGVIWFYSELPASGKTSLANAVYDLAQERDLPAFHVEVQPPFKMSGSSLVQSPSAEEIRYMIKDPRNIPQITAILLSTFGPMIEASITKNTSHETRQLSRTLSIMNREKVMPDGIEPTGIIKGIVGAVGEACATTQKPPVIVVDIVEYAMLGTESLQSIFESVMSGVFREMPNALFVTTNCGAIRIHNHELRRRLLAVHFKEVKVPFEEFLKRSNRI